MKRHILIDKLLISSLFIFLIAGCGSGELDRTKAKSILLIKYKDDFNLNCKLHESLYSKPEFADIKDELFCKTNIEVTGIQKISDAEAIVEWKNILNGNIKELEKWKLAMAALKNRLTELEPIDRKVIGQPYNFFWIFKDPIDDQEYLHDITQTLNYGDVWGSRPPDISKSDRFKIYEQEEEKVNLLINLNYDRKKTLESAVFKTTMRLYDDGWRAQQDKGLTYNYSITTQTGAALTKGNPISTESSTFAETQFIGSWSYNNGADLLEISKNGTSFNVLWKSKDDGYLSHKIECKLIGEGLFGDYYGGKQNFKVKIIDNKNISLTIDPFAEFEPIKNQYFSRVN